jgi:hypothetical protein
MSGSHPSHRSHGLPARLAAWLGLAWLAGTLIAAAASTAFSQQATIVTLVASAPALAGVVAGLGALAIIAGIKGVDASVAIVGAGLIRLILGTLAALVTRAAAGLEDRPFWFAFLFILGCVMAAEVAVAYRLLNKETARA